MSLENIEEVRAVLLGRKKELELELIRVEAELKMVRGYIEKILPVLDIRDAILYVRGLSTKARSQNE